MYYAYRYQMDPTDAHRETLDRHQKIDLDSGRIWV
jgi:hypothetical protein